MGPEENRSTSGAEVCHRSGNNYGGNNKRREAAERQTSAQRPEAYEEHLKRLSTRFGFLFNDDKIRIPQAIRRAVITLLYKSHPAISKMSAAAKPFFWPKLAEAMQMKCDERNPCITGNTSNILRRKQRRGLRPTNNEDTRLIEVSQPFVTTRTENKGSTPAIYTNDLSADKYQRGGGR